MPPQTLENRVERLADRVTVMEQLTARMDALASQISQLRDEVNVGFSATSTRIDGVEKSLRQELHAVDERLSTQMRVLHEDVIGRLTLIQEGLPRQRKR